MINNEFLTIEEVCRWQKINRRTLESWCERGLPCDKVGSVVRFDKEEVQNWVNLQKKHINQLDENDTDIIAKMTSLSKKLNGMARASCQIQLKYLIDLKKSGKNIIIIDPENELLEKNT